jgi:hypothetical protein
MSLDYELILHDLGLVSYAATDHEKSLAVEVMQLRAIIAHGHEHHDMRTLRNVQEQKNKVVAALEAYVNDPSMWTPVIGAVRELWRITGESCKS